MSATPSGRTWHWRAFLPISVLLAGVLALGALGYWKYRNSDLLELGATNDWQGQVWDAKSQGFTPLPPEETRTLVRFFSCAHDFHRAPNFSCATCVYYGSPRYFVRLTSPARGDLCLGVWPSGRLASVWHGSRMYSGSSRWIEFEGGADEIASILQAAQKRIELGH